MGHRLQRVEGEVVHSRGARSQTVGNSRFGEGEDMRRHGPWRKFCCLLIMLSCMSVGYAQEASPKVLKKFPVPYPPLLKGKGIGGTVRLKVFIKPDGSVRDMEVIGGNPILVESAQKSVSQWKFSPGNSERTTEIVLQFDPASKQEN
jgi:TonB family protein